MTLFTLALSIYRCSWCGRMVEPEDDHLSCSERENAVLDERQEREEDGCDD